jgi:Leucine-rich repeat (LRR) protein
MKKPEIVMHSVLPKADAQGLVIVPQNILVGLKAGLSIASNPKLFNGFGPNDLACLYLPQAYDWNDSHMKGIKHLQGLSCLDMDNAGITDASLADLDALTNLTDLNYQASELSGLAVARLKRLRALNSLTASRTSEISSVLRALAGSDRLHRLVIADCNVQDTDMKNVGTLSSLETLWVERNDGITDRNLTELTSLKNLTFLDISKTQVTSACIDTLKAFKHLSYLNVDFANWSSADQQRLRKAFPHCTLTTSEPTNKQAEGQATTLEWQRLPGVLSE